MFRHVVMFRWAEGTTEATKGAVRDGLSALPEVIPDIRGYRIGEDAGLVEGNFEFVVVADFDDPDGFTAYRDHPAHQRVVKDLIAPATGQRAALQHEWHAPSDSA